MNSKIIKALEIAGYVSQNTRRIIARIFFRVSADTNFKNPIVTGPISFYVQITFENFTSMAFRLVFIVESSIPFRIRNQI